MLSRWKSSFDAPALGAGWRGLGWAGSAGLGLAAFLTAAARVSPEFHWTNGIVATAAFERYSEGQEALVYLLAVTLAPLFTLAGYALWRGLVGAAERLERRRSEEALAAVSLVHMVWWVRPLTWLARHTTPDAPVSGLPAAALLSLFITGSALALGWAWLRGRGERDFTQTPPAGAWSLGVLVTGFAAGLGWLQGPLGGRLERAGGGSAVLVMAAGLLGLWLAWLGGSYLLGRTRGITWRESAERMAIGTLPLALPVLNVLVWTRTVQGGQAAAETGRLAAVLLAALSLLGSASLVAWAYSRQGGLEREARRRLFWRSVLLVVAPVTLYVMAYSPNIHRALDLFHEGESLAPAYAIWSGKAPYREVVFVHGFLRDPGAALLAFAAGEMSVAGLRALTNILTPLIVVGNYLLALLVLRSWWVVPVGLLMFTGLWPWFYDWRIAPALLALVCWMAYIDSRRPAWAAGAGVFTFLALATSTDIGLVCLAAGLGLAAGLSVQAWREAGGGPASGGPASRGQRVQPLATGLLASFLAPLLSGGLLAVVYLGANRALGAFVEWNWHILQVYRDWNGMPFPFPPISLRQGWMMALSPAASALALVVLARRAVHGRWAAPEWKALLLLGANLLIYNRALVSASTASSALEAGSHFAPLLLLALAAPVSESISIRKTAVLAALGLVLLAPTPLQVPAGTTVLDLVDRIVGRSPVAVPDGWRMARLARLGAVYLPPEQADRLEAIVPYLAAAESVWDFSDHPALYFLSEQTSPARYYNAHHMITPGDQRRAIAELSKDPPQVVVYRSNTDWDAIAGIDRTLRSDLVSAYLLQNYHYAATLGGFILLERGAPGEPNQAAEELAFEVNLGFVPLLWGQAYDEALKNVASPAESCRFEPGSVQAGGAAHTSPSRCAVDPRQASYLLLRMEVNAPEGRHLPVRLSWRSPGESFASQKSVTFMAESAGEQAYLMHLGALPGWAWSQPVAELLVEVEDGSLVRGEAQWFGAAGEDLLNR